MDWLLTDPSVVAGLAALRAAAVALAATVLGMLAWVLWGIRPVLQALAKEWLQNLLNDRLAKAAERSVGEQVVALGRDATPEALQAKVADMASNLRAKMTETLEAAGASPGTPARFVAGALADKILAANAAAAVADKLTPGMLYELGTNGVRLPGDTVR